ncbi:NAD(P)-binding protein [Gaiella sp.]|uniref:oxidoreductase n=1 Tax=Gaiella sp. TaxID=2663207 RepID=UPI003982FB4A
MSREARHDILFEPVEIGPVTARNRFFQVPHCNGMGHRDPTPLAFMRGVKAEGGWAVVCTEEVEIHPSTEVSPYAEGRLWDDEDIPALARMVDKVHEHGSLAGIELLHNGRVSSNLYSRLTSMTVDHMPTDGYEPVQSRRMALSDIDDLRRRHRAAARRSLQAGFDIVYVYAGHYLNTIGQFLSPRLNGRTDGYGGDATARARLLREVLEDTLAEVDGRAAVACRIMIDDLSGPGGFGREEIEAVLALTGELPDLWDFVAGEWENDSVTSRFGEEGSQEIYLRGLKQLTTKPVVGVGRFTSPDLMARMVREGVMDFVGAARPSIADPFLPVKIEEGRYDDIRECIGCNICVSGDATIVPIRCTQNPSMGEEWRRGWHPETYRPAPTPAKVLVVGAGPAGLEAAMSLGKRGYDVVLAEATRSLGGRAKREARLPGLASWIRVVDYRKGQLDRLGNVEIALESRLSADEILSYDFDHVAVATGCAWRRDGGGRWHPQGLLLTEGVAALTPDDILGGARPAGHEVVLFDDDHYYMGSVLAELLVREGHAVTLVTPAPRVSEWSVNTMEQHRTQARLIGLGVTVSPSTTLVSAGSGTATVACTYTEAERELACDAVVLVTARLPEETLFTDLVERSAEWFDTGLSTVEGIGDARSPGTIAAAVWDGRRYAEEIDASDPGDGVPFLREIVRLAPHSRS